MTTPESMSAELPRQRTRAGSPTCTPLCSALCLTLIYLVAGIVYITISTYVAAGVAETVEDLHRIETIKGTLYIVFTSVLLLVSSYILLRRLARNEAELSRHHEALIISENRAMAGLMAASVAHDINNALTVIQYGADQLEDPDNKPKEHKDLVASIQTSSAHLKKLVGRLMEMARQREMGEFAQVDLCKISDEVRRATLIHKRSYGCRFDLQCEPDMNVVGNEVVLQQMILNLFLNAVDAAGTRGRVWVGIRKDDDHVLLEVHDSGPGVSDDQREEIFQPLYTTKPEGTGLGLLSVLDCAEALGGSVSVTPSDRLEGACFSVRIPLRMEPKGGDTVIKTERVNRDGA